MAIHDNRLIEKKTASARRLRVTFCTTGSQLAVCDNVADFFAVLLQTHIQAPDSLTNLVPSTREWNFVNNAPFAGDVGILVLDGQDLVCGQERPVARLKRMATTLQEHDLCVLLAHKVGGFAVLNHEVFRHKAASAVLAFFNRNRQVSLKKFTSRARKLSEQLNLMNVVKSIDGCDSDCLEM